MCDKFELSTYHLCKVLTSVSSLAKPHQISFFNLSVTNLEFLGRFTGVGNSSVLIGLILFTLILLRNNRQVFLNKFFTKSHCYALFY